jgi:hypothetical protein
MLVKIDNVLKTVEASNLTSPGGLCTTMPSVSQPMHLSSARAKLPKLSLKKFSGNPTDWQSFYDSYKAAVHTNDSLSKVDKFSYLKSLVEGRQLQQSQGFH